MTDSVNEDQNLTTETIGSPRPAQGWDTFEARSVNGYPYKKENGEWVPDEAAFARQLEREANERQRKDDLIWACRSRVCTEDEMKEIERTGINLFLRFNGGMSQSYSESELERRLDDLLLQQFKLRRAAESVINLPEREAETTDRN